jgi:hypothetical protein
MSITPFPRSTRSAALANATTVLIAVNAHQYSMPVVRETPSLGREPASVAALW